MLKKITSLIRPTAEIIAIFLFAGWAITATVDTIMAMQTKYYNW